MDYQFTKKEWEEEVEFYHRNGGPLQKPDPKDPTDPLYYIKWPHTLPPLQAYLIKAAGQEK